MKPLIPIVLGTVLLVVLAPPVVATDPPHNAVRSIECVTCHTPHAAPGGTLNTIAGNANLCQSCHMPGGPSLPLNDADQALPSPGLPAGTPASGNSHRWDSGPAGHVEPGATNASPGRVDSAGIFTGRFSKTYTLTITTAGDTGSAVFSWTDTEGGGAAGLLSGTAVPLDAGVSVSFTDGTGSPSFLLNDEWRVYVRTEINAPSDPEMVLRLDDGKIMCSTCHNQHNQSLQPFDPLAPPYLGPGTGWLRHYQRVDNDTNQMCVECHLARNVTQASQGSHPVGVAIPGGDFNPPAIVSLDAAGNVACLSCHRVHQANTNDGTLARLANTNTLCSDCHTLADTATPASHLDAGGGVLWPGGQYGSSFPQITDAGKRGFCINCHSPHGWPDDGTPAQDYPTLLVETPTDLCVTCHDGNPASDQLVDFSSTLFVTGEVGDSNNLNLNTRHDVKASDQAISGTDLACSDCHDPHTATPSAKLRADPDPDDGRVPTAGFSWSGSDLESEWCLDCHDGSFPAGVTPPTTALVDIRDEFLTSDDHGLGTANNLDLKPGYGWAQGDIVPCTACHVLEHGSTNLFQLRTTVYSKDGLTPIPSDCGGTTVEFTDNDIVDTAVNGWCFCNTCHVNSMGDNRANCFDCHAHGDRF